MSAGTDATVPAEEPEAEGVECCELCGHPVVHRHCKIVCTHCGLVRDCSDP